MADITAKGVQEFASITLDQWSRVGDVMNALSNHKRDALVYAFAANRK